MIPNEEQLVDHRILVEEGLTCTPNELRKGAAFGPHVDKVCVLHGNWTDSTKLHITSEYEHGT